MKSSLRRRRRQQQSAGFALLFIFMMAAAVVIMLYREMPRVVFEGQREREQLTIERGEQYKRAIQVYIRKNKKYPTDLDDLDKTGDIHYLRRRYKDPLTGSDEWRIIHVNAGGQLTDSLVTPLSDPAGEKKAAYDPFGTAAAAQQDQQNVTPGLVQRASDQPAAIAGQNPFPNTNPTDPNQQQNGDQPPASPFPPGYQIQDNGQPIPGQSATATVNTVNTSQPGAALATGQPGQQTGTGLPYPVNQLPGAVPGGVNPTQAGANPQTPAGGTANNSALNMIRNILTTPRPGGFPGATQTSQQQAGLGAGIAGIASKAEGEGIMIYNEHSPYEEWEFVYDPTKDPNAALARGGQGGGGGPQGRTGQQGAGPGPNGSRTGGPPNIPGFPFPQGGNRAGGGGRRR